MSYDWLQQFLNQSNIMKINPVVNQLLKLNAHNMMHEHLIIDKFDIILVLIFSFFCAEVS